MTAGGSGPLGGWYARPLSRQEALDQLAAAERREQELLRRGGRCRTCPLLTLIARFWLGERTEPALEAARRKLRGTAHGRALADLIAGQLRMSRRQPGALRLLRRGFDHASDLFTPADYLEVLRRHRLLAQLPAVEGEPDLEAEDLPALLEIAGVIARMRGSASRRTRITIDRTDIYG